MSRKTSAGLLLYREQPGLEVLLVHPGGPFWAKRDLGAWSIPKGEFEEDEDPLEAAKREFAEETGLTATGSFEVLTPLRQHSGKTVFAWALRSNLDITQVKSNSFQMEWPPKSGRLAEFPEIDRAEWFGLTEARRRILPGQAPFLEELAAKLGVAVKTEGSRDRDDPQKSLF